MSHSPLVSVVMPVYNTAAYLKEAVESILGQTFQDFELVAVNDGATDGSGEILDGYAKRDGRVRVIHQENTGISGARNAGTRNASGRYIAVMDSDDIAMPSRLAEQVEFMEGHPEVGVLATRCSFFGDGGEFIGPPSPGDPERIKCKMLFTATISHTSTMMRREPIVKHGLYYRTDFATTEDFEVYTRFLEHHRIAALPEVLLKIRTHAASTTRLIPDEEHYRNISRVHGMEIPRFFGIIPTDEELEAHLSLCTWAFPRTRENIGVVDRWLCRLTEANRSAEFYDGDILAEVLLQKWYQACALIRGPLLWKWGRFRRSPVCADGVRASGASVVTLAMRLARFHISVELEQTRSGRSFKRLAKSLVLSRLRL